MVFFGIFYLTESVSRLTRVFFSQKLSIFGDLYLWLTVLKFLFLKSSCLYVRLDKDLLNLKKKDMWDIKTFYGQKKIEDTIYSVLEISKYC